MIQPPFTAPAPLPDEFKNCRMANILVAADKGNQ